ncbi:glucosyltransferase domain-containing protein [Enterobacter hormaechei]|uniref:glucosyltransferase domain-containing protein n=1 Tax=Enterobacter hormaechei TaxID=158836 RepID=UPI00298A9B76|nr:glucosyltransferase domain-containing protein [Enterobacter hormaechei]HBL5177922.1 glucosyltransferase domain-containing protein [Enterobacter hormaechei]HBL6016951.1 glucosyltransferase domain-containing protein [Enterobacter hormaechei]HBL6131259.1 glucosyltransferase domain-containing protein [Enterobacter hormaechei]HBL8998212.1 glucosyltransferase domain-containing protein [Enterobacter hormaechei]
MRFNNKDKGFLIVLSCMILLYILPIILADRLYIDDILRSQLGYKSWGINGRPLADWIVSALNLSIENITDLSPLPLLVACLVFCTCSMLYFRENLQHLSYYKSAIIFFIVFANPFMLENISYKFDVLPMVLSLSVLLMPYSFGLKNAYCTALGSLCVLASLSLYQASITFFCSLALLEFFLQCRNNANYTHAIGRAFNRLFQFLFGYIAYHFVAKIYIEGEYNQTHSQIIDISMSGLSAAYATANSFNDKILSVAYEVPSFIYLILFISAVYIIINAIRGVSSKSFVGYLSAGILLVSPILAYLFTFVHLSVLKYPVITDRVLISFGGYLMYLMVVFYSSLRGRYVTSIIMIPIILFSYVYSYTYGNALKYQKEYDIVLSQDISKVILDDDPDAKKTIKIYGTQNSSEQRTNAIRRFPSLETLVPLYYTFGWWGTHMLKMYDIQNTVTASNDLGYACEMHIISSGRRFFAYSDDQTILISFERPKCN